MPENLFRAFRCCHEYEPTAVFGDQVKRPRIESKTSRGRERAEEASLEGVRSIAAHECALETAEAELVTRPQGVRGAVAVAEAPTTRAQKSRLPIREAAGRLGREANRRPAAGPGVPARPLLVRPRNWCRDVLLAKARELPGTSQPSAKGGRRLFVRTRPGDGVAGADASLPGARGGGDE